MLEISQTTGRSLACTRCGNKRNVLILSRETRYSLTSHTLAQLCALCLIDCLRDLLQKNLSRNDQPRPKDKKKGAK